MFLPYFWHYRTCTITIWSWFETALNFKPRIFLYYKLLYTINRSINVVCNIFDNKKVFLWLGWHPYRGLMKKKRITKYYRLQIKTMLKILLRIPLFYSLCFSAASKALNNWSDYVTSCQWYRLAIWVVEFQDWRSKIWYM